MRSVHVYITLLNSVIILLGCAKKKFVQEESYSEWGVNVFGELR